MFALASQKKTIVAQALTRVDKHFAGGDNISDFATIIGDYADFCDIRRQTTHLLRNAMESFQQFWTNSDHDDHLPVDFTYLGTRIEIAQCRGI